MRSKILFAGLLLIGTTMIAGTHRDGIYRGFYDDQVEIQFTLKNDIVTASKYRNLFFKGVDYNKSEDPTILEWKAEHEALLTHLEGTNITQSLDDLYNPGDIEMAGATMRSNKVRSAIQDGLNRGAYNLAK